MVLSESVVEGPMQKHRLGVRWTHHDRGKCWWGSVLFFNGTSLDSEPLNYLANLKNSKNIVVIVINGKLYYYDDVVVILEPILL